MAALGLHDHIHILPGGKARAECNGQRSHVPRSAKVVLCKDGVHEHVRLCLCNAASRRIHQNRHGVFCPDRLCLSKRIDADCLQALHNGFSFIDGFTQRDLPPDGRRVFRFQNQDPQPGGPQAVNGTGGEVAAAAHKDQRIVLHPLFSSSAGSS